MENMQIRPNFLRLTATLLYKILPKNLVACKPDPFILFNIRFEVKEYYEALFLSYGSRTERSTQFCKTNITLSFNIQDDGSTGTRGLLAIQCVKKIDLQCELLVFE